MICKLQERRWQKHDHNSIRLIHRISNIFVPPNRAHLQDERSSLHDISSSPPRDGHFRIVGLVNKNYNTVYGECTLVPVYDPPHCEGLEDGTVREGFTIPCRRGKNKAFFQWYSSIVLMVPPFAIIIAFGMIYWSVREQEKKN